MNRFTVEELVALINIRANSYINNKSNTSDNHARLLKLEQTAQALVDELVRIRSTRSISESHWENRK